MDGFKGIQVDIVDTANGSTHVKPDLAGMMHSSMYGGTPIQLNQSAVCVVSRPDKPPPNPPPLAPVKPPAPGKLSQLQVTQKDDLKGDEGIMPENKEVKKANASLESEKRWKASIDAVLNLLKPKKVLPIVTSRYKSLTAKKMTPLVMSLLSEVSLFDLNTNTVIDKLDPNIGLMQENCIPFYIMAVICLLNGVSASVKIFEDALAMWIQIKELANAEINDDEVAHDVLLAPVTNHARTAFQRYMALLMMNTEPGMCKDRAAMIIGWMKILKNDTKVYKDRMMLEQEIECHKAAHMIGYDLPSPTADDRELVIQNPYA